MNWKYLIELECERELAKPWSREQAKASTFVIPHVLPPSHFTIQGLAPAPRPKGDEKKRKCDECRHRLRFGGCAIKRRMGLQLKGYCPIEYRAKKHRPAEPRGRYELANIPDICSKCALLDKVRKECLIQRLGRGICIHAKRAKPASNLLGKPQTIRRAPISSC